MDFWPTLILDKIKLENVSNASPGRYFIYSIDMKPSVVNFERALDANASGDFKPFEVGLRWREFSWIWSNESVTDVIAVVSAWVYEIVSSSETGSLYSIIMVIHANAHDIA